MREEIKNGFKTRLSRKYSEKFFVTLDSVPWVTYRNLSILIPRTSHDLRQIAYSSTIEMIP